MKIRSNRTALVAFFSLTFALSWIVWGSSIAFEAGTIDWQLPAPLAFLAVSFSAVVITAIVAGRSGLTRLGSRMITWRVHVKWYVAALVIPALPALVALGVFLALGGQHDVSALVPLAGAVPLLLTQLLLHLLTEEVGWRGFALPRLRTRFSALAASVILGLVWAAWHLPLFFVPDTRQTYPVVGFVIQVVAITVIMTWIFDNTRGSVLIAAIFHAAMNTSWAVLNILWGDLLLFWLCVGFTVVAAAIVAVVQGRGKMTAEEAHHHEHLPESPAASLDKR